MIKQDVRGKQNVLNFVEIYYRIFTKNTRILEMFPKISFNLAASCNILSVPNYD